MRAGLSTILKTLTPATANILNQSISEAGRRNHNQTTPLHVAAALLASPTGFFRQACIRAHPNSSHPLQCRALELCFSVALERLPSNACPAVTEPPVSNALTAALKRAQAHQRRGCPEQQQQPLLAVKVEVEQLIISILDDPSVSRVMREACFSSTAVKAVIEQSLNNNISGGNYRNASSLGIGFRPSTSSTNPVPVPINRNMYHNPRSPFSGRLDKNGMFGSSLESLNSFDNAARMPPCCPKCVSGFEHELASLNGLEKSSVEAKSNLPKWLQNATIERGETEMESETKMPHRSRVNDQELRKKRDICSRIHTNDNQIPSFARTGTGLVPTFKPNRLLCRTQTGQQQNAPSSPVRTELVLGPKEVDKCLPVKDYLGFISSETRAKGDETLKGKFVNSADTDSFKKLLKGLMKKAWWQPEAASTIATTITQCGSRGGRWLLFAGPDRVGKKKMASALSEYICGADPITICLRSRHDDNELDFGFRGKTVLDRVVEAVRGNPVSVIVLSDIDEADILVHRGIKQAMERGRLTDSHGREVRLGNIIFVLTGNWSTNYEDEIVGSQRLHTASTADWHLKLTVCKKRLKRRADWVLERNMSTKQQKKVGPGLSLDLNLAVDAEEAWTDTSDLTIEQGDENLHFQIPLVSLPHELVGPSDGAVVFKPVQYGPIRHEIEKTLKNVCSRILDDNLPVEIDETTLDNIISGLWLGRTSLEEWVEQVLVPSFQKLVGHLPSSVDDLVVRLEPDSDPDLDRSNHGGDRLPSKINVIVDIV